MIGRMALALATTLLACSPASAVAQATAASDAYDGVSHPDWVKSGAIYELSLRQFTREGTLAAAQRDLPRLKALGVSVVWLMPIHPVGRVRAVPPMGSPYAVRDYRAIDPAYGNLADLQRFVAAAHALGLHVILDWVANHSSWDNALVVEHPDWYMHGSGGRPRSPAWFTWGDVAEFDYSSAALRRYMVESMTFWVRVAGVDGFRADAAGLVPLDFWEEARSALMRVKPVFMLGEWEARDLSFRAFDMTYGWSWVSAMDKIAAGQGSIDELRTWMAWNGRFWPRNALRMLYVSNHDVIGSGTEFERYGPALDAAIALSILNDGVPLIFNGQEAGNRQRLTMFRQDPIDWREDAEGELYRRLLGFRSAHQALWARPWGGRPVEVETSNRANLFAFRRDAEKDSVIAIFNLSKDTQRGLLSGIDGTWRDLDGRPADLKQPLELAPWSYLVLSR